MFKHKESLLGGKTTEKFRIFKDFNDYTVRMLNWIRFKCFDGSPEELMGRA